MSHFEEQASEDWKEEDQYLSLCYCGHPQDDHIDGDCQVCRCEEFVED